jgi:hypothetical protein
MKKFFLLFLPILVGCGASQGPDVVELENPLRLVFVEMSTGEAFEGEGAIGCGDRQVVVESTIPASDNMEENVAAALELLFSSGSFWDVSEQQGIGDVSFDFDKGEGPDEDWLYNGLQHSEGLLAVSVSSGVDGLDVRLKGSLISAGTCDDPRIVEQINATVLENLSFGYSMPFKVFINDVPLDEYFDMRG